MNLILSFFLSFFLFLVEKENDRTAKRITVVFCESQEPGSTRDWKSNFNFFLAPLKTLARIKDKMKGELQNQVLVHRGFHNYLFENRKLVNRERPQR